MRHSPTVDFDFEVFWSSSSPSRTSPRACGPVIHDQDESVFVAVQHPGEDGSGDEQASCFRDFVADGASTSR